jgi:drug/metabolite transporter (DMT)-like permease
MKEVEIMENGKKLLIFQLILVGVIWGASYNAGKYVVHYFPPLSAASWRFAIATIFMLVFLLFIKGVQKEALKQNIWIYIFMGLVGIVGMNTLFFLGLMNTSAVNGALIMGTNPLVTVLLSSLFLRIKVNKTQILGLVLSLIGVILVISKGSFGLLFSLSFTVGDIYILIGNICWALYAVIGKKWLKNSSAIATTTFSMGFGTLLLIVLGNIEVGSNYQYLSSVPVSAWITLFFLGFFASFLAYLWWNKGINTIGANNTSVFYNLVPATSLLISFIEGDQVYWGQIIGFIVIVIGVTLALKSGWEIKSFSSKNKVKSLN